MKTKILQISELWADCLTAAGIVGLSCLLGFYAREFAMMTQANLFFTDWGFF